MTRQQAKLKNSLLELLRPQGSYSGKTKEQPCQGITTEPGIHSAIPLIKVASRLSIKVFNDRKRLTPSGLVSRERGVATADQLDTAHGLAKTDLILSHNYRPAKLAHPRHGA